MSFLSGRVSYTRLRVVGGSPKRLDDNLLEKFRAHAIGKQRVMRSDREEVGWTGGQHLLDREFSVEKNVLLECLHLGMRADSVRVPPELMRAYVQMEYDALCAKSPDGGGRGAAKLKKAATDAAKARAEQEVRDGRYRSQRAWPVLWDTREDVLYFGSTQPAAIERLQRLFRDTFDRRLEVFTSGRAACAWAESSGLSRRMEALQPSRFVTPPDDNTRAEVSWATHDPASRDYLGNEFVLWLWYVLSEETDTLKLAANDEASVIITKLLTLECPWAQFGRVVVTAEGPARLPESRRAIAGGKLPRRVGLILTRDEEPYELVLGAEGLTVSSCLMPPIEEKGSALMEERVEQVRRLANTLDGLFRLFLVRRLSNDWEAERGAITLWLRSIDAASHRTDAAASA